MPKPCPTGRQQAAGLASMNMRAVVGPVTLMYLARPRPRIVPSGRDVGPRFQPRDAHGRFVSYARLASAINRDCARTQHAYDVIDAGGN